MKCPNCNNNLEKRSICPHCGIDAVLFKKTTYISNRYYNQGLASAKVGNYTEAEGALSKSLEYNRFNHQARNLLGLIYYETGLIGEALKHWVISAGYLKTDNPAASYIDDLQTNSRLLDKLNESIVLYNRALEDVRLKNEDMAIIQLRKAIDSNPKFVEAYNLLTFCYIYQKDNDKALSSAAKTLETDCGNVKALAYHKILSAGGAKPDVKIKAPREPKRHRTNVNKNAGRSYPLTEIITFLIGAVCALGISYILIAPDIKNNYAAEISAANEEIARINQLHSDEIAKKDEALKALEDEMLSLAGSKEKLDEEVELQARIDKVLQANAHFLDGEHEEAANIIQAVDVSGFASSALRIYNNIKDTTYPGLEKKFYDEGLRQFNARKYVEAKELFEKSLIYTVQGSVYTDGNYYFLGRIAENDGDNALAKSYYEIIVNDYPNSYQAANARSRLRGL